MNFVQIAVSVGEDGKKAIVAVDKFGNAWEWQRIALDDPPAAPIHVNTVIQFPQFERRWVKLNRFENDPS
jgi:hypothetical protein